MRHPGRLATVEEEVRMTIADKLRTKSERPSTRRVSLKLVHVDVWSATKLGFVISLGIGVVSVVADLVLWGVLSALGVFGQIDALVGSLAPSGPTSNVAAIVSPGTVLLFALLGAILGTIGGTLLAAIAALLYNLSVRMTRGILVGMANG
jgi:hypothetical protein